MTRLSQKNNLIIWSIIGTVLVSGLVWLNFAYLPTKLTQDKNKVLDSLVNIELNSRQKLNLSSLSKQLEQIQDSSAKLNKAFFDRTQALKLVEYIENLAVQYNVEQDLNLTEPSRNLTSGQKGFVLEEKALSLSLTGSIDGLLNFLKAFESNESYTLITLLELRQSEQNSYSLVIAGTVPWH